MLTNYLKIAWRSLLRNKIYTFISLFGISFTLMVLMLSISFVDTELGANSPLTKKERIVTTIALEMARWERNEEQIIDTSYVDGQMVLDTITNEIINKKATESNSGATLGERFIKNNLLNLQHVETMSIFNTFGGIIVYKDDQKIEFKTTYCDEKYFTILDFQFIEGNPFTKNQVENSLPVTIITEDKAKEYFGKLPSYIGKTIHHVDKNYEVIGVIEKVNKTIAKADMILPYTLMAASELNYGHGEFGSLNCLFLTPTKKDKIGLSKELRAIETSLEGTFDSQFDELSIIEKDINNAYASSLLFTEENKFYILQWIFFGGLSFFILIPLLNLIHLNMQRMIERASEIGVRKSYGATQKHIITQVILENVLLTLVGGIIGFIITLAVLQWIKTSYLFKDVTLQFSQQFYVLSLVIIVILGTLTAVIPALRISTLRISESLKLNS